MACRAAETAAPGCYVRLGRRGRLLSGLNYHGGILSTFVPNWYDKQVESVQHGLGKNGPRSAVHGDLVCGPPTFSKAKLKKNRADLPGELRKRKLDDDWYRGRSADWSQVEVPFLSAGNWGGQGLHPRGNIEGFVNAASKQKWLEMHGREHWTEFYTDYGLDLQKRFFGHFLKGEDTGWQKQPKVLLNIRHPGEAFVPRAEKEWPLKRTRWTKRFLHPRQARWFQKRRTGKERRPMPVWATASPF